MSNCFVAYLITIKHLHEVACINKYEIIHREIYKNLPYIIIIDFFRACHIIIIIFF